MTYPLPDRLAPVRAEVHRYQGVIMWALISLVIAAISFAFAFFGYDFDGHSLIALGLFFLAVAHLLGPVVIPSRRV